MCVPIGHILTFNCCFCWSFPRSICYKTKRDTNWKGEGPSYMKVPYIDPQFKVISNHHYTVFGKGEYLGLEGRHKNAFICICTSVSMCVLAEA